MNRTIIYLSLIASILFSCANPQPPSGGPEDKTPPKIIKSTPESGTTNFTDESIELEFNKHMMKNQVTQNIFISPTTKLEFGWHGKTLEVEFAEPLDSATTYAISLGTDYTDYYSKNKPEKAYTIIFSTGSRIDSGKISGMMYHPEPSGAYIYVYRIDRINPDTLDPSQNEPRYRTQVGSTGEFEIAALKDGVYRLFAVRDQLKNYIYDHGMDGFGAPPDDIRVSADSVAAVRLRLGHPIDEIGPMLYGVIPKNEKLITVNFSENIDSSKVSRESFAITDSTGAESAEIVTSYVPPNKPKKVLVRIKSPLDTAVKWKLTALPDTNAAVRDTMGNFIRDTANTGFFKPSVQPDTIRPTLLAPPLMDSTTGVDPNRTFTFVYNIAFDRLIFFKETNLIKADSAIPAAIDFNWIAANRFEIVPKNKLAGNTWYRLDIPTDKVVGLNGMETTDSSMSLNFQTVDVRNYGSIDGTLTDSSGNPRQAVIELAAIQGSEIYRTEVDSSGSWSIPELPPREYKVRAYIDENGNGEYDFGHPFPFRYGEKFFFIEESLEIRQRWGVEDFKIVLPE